MTVEQTPATEAEAVTQNDLELNVSEPLNMGELEDMLSLKERETEVPKEPGETQGEKSEGEVVATPPAPPTAAPNPPDSVQPKEDEVVLLKTKLAEMQGKLEVLTQTQVQPPKPAEKAGAEFPNYHLDVPDEIMSALGSEDAKERKHGVAALAYGISMNLHANIRKEMEEQLRAIPVVVQRMMETQSTHKDVVKDFYEKFPQLNTPELRTLVANVTPSVMKELGAQGWNPQVRDAIGSRVLSALQAALPKTQTPAQPTPPARQPAVFGGTTRAAEPVASPFDDVLTYI